MRKLTLKVLNRLWYKVYNMRKWFVFNSTTYKSLTVLMDFIVNMEVKLKDDGLQEQEG